MLQYLLQSVQTTIVVVCSPAGLYFEKHAQDHILSRSVPTHRPSDNLLR